MSGPPGKNHTANERKELISPTDAQWQTLRSAGVGRITKAGSRCSAVKAGDKGLQGHPSISWELINPLTPVS